MSHATAPRRCDSCDELVHEPWRARHRDCPPPPRPAAMRDAVAKVRSMRTTR